MYAVASAKLGGEANCVRSPASIRLTSDATVSLVDGSFVANTGGNGFCSVMISLSVADHKTQEPAPTVTNNSNLDERT